MDNTKEIITRFSLQEWVQHNICTLERIEQHLRIGWESWRSMIPAQIISRPRYALISLTDTSAVKDKNRLEPTRPRLLL